jgi:hypothetical protein
MGDGQGLCGESPRPGLRHHHVAHRRLPPATPVPRTAALYLCRKHTGLAAATIARAFNRRSPAVAYAVRSIERLLTEEPRLGELLSEVEREFGPKCWDHGEDQKKRPQHE